MTDEEFKQKLSEVAEWKIPETVQETSLNRKRRRGRPSDEDLYQEAHEEIFLEEFGGVNPTYPPMIIKLKIQPEQCDDCGKLCPEGRRKEKKLFDTNNIRNWREKCVTCNMAKNPFTGQFELTPTEAPHVWTNFLRLNKGLYKTAGNQARTASTVVVRNSSDREDSV